MKITFIDNNNQLPLNYSIKSSNSEQTRIGPDGRVYKLWGIGEKNCRLNRRIRLGVLIFAKTLFSLGLALLSRQVRQDWKRVWIGKKQREIYSSSLIPPDPTPISSPVNLMHSSNRHNEHEEKIIQAQRAVSNDYNQNPYFLINRYRVYYEKTFVGSNYQFKQRWDNPWEKALEAGDEETVKKFLEDPYFKGHNSCKSPLLLAIEHHYLSIFKFLVESKETNLDDTFWSQEEQKDESLLLVLIKQQKEDYIHILLDNGYDINLLEKSYHSLPSYQTLSVECRNKIEQAIQINSLNNDYNSLEEAILEGDLDQVKKELIKGVCINHRKINPLRLAIQSYMKEIPGNIMIRITNGKRLSSEELIELLKNRREIINILLQDSQLRLQSLNNEFLILLSSYPYKPDDWESLAARLIEKGVDPTKGDVLKLFQVMEFEQLSENGPFKKALNSSHQIILKNCLNKSFIETVFGLKDGNLTFNVYKMLQLIWDRFKTFDNMVNQFSLQTIQALDQSISAIPLNFENEQAEELLVNVRLYCRIEFYFCKLL